MKFPPNHVRAESDVVPRAEQGRAGRGTWLAVVVLFVLVFGDALILVRLSDSTHRIESMPPTNGSPTVHLDPETGVLSTHDLPNYKLISSTAAKLPDGGTTRDGWDNVFQKSYPGQEGYRVVEAIVVVYGSVADAESGVDELRQTEESHGATAAPALGGAQSTIWKEPLGIAGYALVRVVFRIDDVVAQVGLLGSDKMPLTDEARAIAAAQAGRLQELLHSQV